MSDSAARLLSDDPWASSLGVELIDAGPGSATVGMDLGEDHMNFLGGAHGGALFSVVEAAVRAAADGRDTRTRDIHLSLTAGGRVGDRFVATAERVAGSRALATYRVVVVREDGRVVGSATCVVRN